MTIDMTIVGGGTIGYRMLQTSLLTKNEINIIGITKRNFYDADGQYLVNNYPELIFPVSKLEEKLEQSDIVLDCTDKAAHSNMKLYKQFPHLKVIMQGGEQDGIADTLFNAYLDYEKAKDASIVKVHSCNDTNFSRIYYALDDLPLTFGIWSLCRRGADPKQSSKGPINGAEIGTDSHHAKHVMMSLPELQLISNTYKASFTEMHVQVPTLASKKKVSVDDIIERLEQVPRIILVNKKIRVGDNEVTCMPTTTEVREYGRKLAHIPGRFGDIYETVIWRDEISVNEIDPFNDGRKLYLISIPTAVHQEAIVIPENLDAIRAMTSKISAEESRALTDKMLGMGRGWK